MVFLAETSDGLTEALRLVAGDPVSCGADAIAEEEFAELKYHNVTRFNYALGSHAPGTLADAVATIQEHHPGQ